jgi:hypothetical protein
MEFPEKSKGKSRKNPRELAGQRRKSRQWKWSREFRNANQVTFRNSKVNISVSPGSSVHSRSSFSMIGPTFRQQALVMFKVLYSYFEGFRFFGDGNTLMRSRIFQWPTLIFSQLVLIMINLLYSQSERIQFFWFWFFVVTCWQSLRSFYSTLYLR